MPKAEPDQAAADTPAGKHKAMVYVSAEVHRAMKSVAAAQGRSVSDAYVEATLAYLAAREAGGEGARHPDPQERVASASGTVVDAIDRLTTALIDASRGRSVLDSIASKGGDDRPAAGTAIGKAVQPVLDALAKAGAAGIKAWDLSCALQRQGIADSTAMNVLTVLKAVGAARYEERRWYSATLSMSPQEPSK